MDNTLKLTLNGAQHELMFETGAARILKHKFKKDVFAIIPELDGVGALCEHVGEIVYAGMHNYHSVNRKPIDFTIDDVMAWVDALKPAELLPIFTAFIYSYVEPLKEVVKKPSQGGEGGEPFHVDADRKDMPGATDDAPVGNGLIHIQRPGDEDAGLRRADKEQGQADKGTGVFQRQAVPEGSEPNH